MSIAPTELYPPTRSGPNVPAGNPDLIVVGTNRIARAFRAATSTIPIVGEGLSFPAEYGLAVSLARPGGNLTGTTDDAGPEIAAKALELLGEAVRTRSTLQGTAI